jgi:hypothetical protein
LNVLAFDPGETTGYALVNGVTGQIELGEINLWHGAEELLDKYKPELVAIEAFKLYPFLAASQSWRDFPSAQVIGVLRNECEQRHIEYVMQMASEIKGFTFKAKGRRVCVTKHTLDALRHALLLMKRRKIDGCFAGCLQPRRPNTNFPIPPASGDVE